MNFSLVLRQGESDKLHCSHPKKPSGKSLGGSREGISEASALPWGGAELSDSCAFVLQPGCLMGPWLGLTEPCALEELLHTAGFGGCFPLSWCSRRAAKLLLSSLALQLTMVRPPAILTSLFKHVKPFSFFARYYFIYLFVCFFSIFMGALFRWPAIWEGGRFIP